MKSKRILPRFGFILFGLFIITLPLVHLITGRQGFLWGQPLSPLGDFSMVVFGIIVIFLSIYRPSLLVKEWYICPECEETMKLAFGKKYQCPDCKVNMVKLKGYYK